MKSIVLFLSLLLTLNASADVLNVDFFSSGQFITISRASPSTGGTLISFSDDSGQSNHQVLSLDRHYVVEQLCAPDTVQTYGRRNNIRCFVR